MEKITKQYQAAISAEKNGRAVEAQNLFAWLAYRADQRAENSAYYNHCRAWAAFRDRMNEKFRLNGGVEPSDMP